jgi:hypothetical protein
MLYTLTGSVAFVTNKSRVDRGMHETQQIDLQITRPDLTVIRAKLPPGRSWQAFESGRFTAGILFALH